MEDDLTQIWWIFEYNLGEKKHKTKSVNLMTLPWNSHNNDNFFLIIRNPHKVIKAIHVAAFSSSVEHHHLELNYELVGEIRHSGLGFTSLSSRAGLNTRVWFHKLHRRKLLRQVLNPLQVKSVQDLEREHNLVQLHMPVHPFEDPRTTSHRQAGVLVSQVGSLDRNVTIVPEIEAVHGLVSVTFLFRLAFDQNAQTSRYPQAFLKISGVYLTKFVKNRYIRLVLTTLMRV